MMKGEVRKYISVKIKPVAVASGVVEYSRKLQQSSVYCHSSLLTTQMVSSLEPQQGRVDYWHPKGGHHDFNSQTYSSHSAHNFLIHPLVLASHLALHEVVIDLCFSWRNTLLLKHKLGNQKIKIHEDKKQGPACIRLRGKVRKATCMQAHGLCQTHTTIDCHPLDFRKCVVF